MTTTKGHFVLEKDITKEEFEKFFREYYSRIYYFAHRFVFDEEVCRDLVSECFMQMWNNISTIDSDKMTGYLFTSVRNKSLTYLKKNKAINMVDNSLLQDLSTETEDSWIQREERLEAMEEEMNKLSERTRYVLEQCYYNGHTYKEVADMLDISVSGVKKHIVKALAQLRSHFNKDKHN